MSETSHKQRTRQRILEEAAAIMRVVGTEGIGVAALMKRVGLTHGGFYAHFSSRDDLVAHVIDQMFSDAAQSLQGLSAAGSAAERLRMLIDLYLSDVARTGPQASCPLPSLAGEAGRLPEAARERFDLGIQALEELLAREIAGLGLADPKRQARSVQAEMIGAMALARAIPDDVRAAERLADSRLALRQRLGIAD